ncbi:hypothetical protein GIW70_00635 [Pseudomonas syringae]|nr:hypothetical protein [Pseudomonas syringae]MCF5066702.1 hypothetical protein [Pseudomonas syringae]
MAKYKKVYDEDPGRAELRAIRLASVRAASAPELEGLLDDVEGDEPNKLPKKFQNTELDVTIPDLLGITAPPNRAVVFRLLWNDVPIGDEKNWLTPLTLPIIVKLPASATLTEGVYNLAYEYTYQGNPYKWLRPVAIYIDKESPNQNAPGEPVTLPAEVIDGILTLEYLEDNDGVEITIPIPTDTRTGDKLEVYYGQSDPGNKVGEFYVTEDRDIEPKIKLDLDKIKEEKEGPKIFYYIWTDRVGNVSPHSKHLPVKVVLTKAPRNLVPPRIPEAVPPEKLIDLSDAFPEVGVIIDQYEDWRPEDEIEVDWDTKIQPRIKVGSGFPVFVDVPYADVRAGGVGPRSVPVAYTVWRNGLDYPETVGETVNVNLSRPGPLPPDPEDPEVGNPNLSEVTVQGSVTTDPNKLELVDADDVAVASFEIADPHPAGDVYTLYWDDVAVPGAVYSATGSEADDFVIELDIQPDFFKGEGNSSAVNVHYKITNATQPNANPSLRQPVSVYVNPVILPTPKINHITTENGFDYVSCSSLRNISNVGWAAEVDVPGGAPLEAGITLEFVWSGKSWQTGSPVDVPDYVFEKILTGTEHTTGFTVYLPLIAALEPIKDGQGSIKYSVTIDGRLEESEPHDVEVVVQDGEGGACQLP